MEIKLTNIGRRFNRDWIFRDVSYSFKQGNSYAILGRNGAGKSTLLQVIAGSLTPSEGQIDLVPDSLPVDDLYQLISIAAPYLELIEEFTLSEMIDFHFNFKSYLNGMDKAALIELIELGSSKNKELKYFSSGMKQRVKIALAICSNTPLLLLDEPCSNFDTEAISWYQRLIQKYDNNRLIIVCSNQEHEYSFCDQYIQLADYK